jgi:hypothetical protein
VEKDYVTIKEVQLLSLGSRCYKMVSWIIENQNEIEGYKDGNISFSFTGGILKVKDENYKQL